MIQSLADVRVGLAHRVSKTIREDELDAFTRLTGDAAPVHTDAQHAASLGFDGRIAHGLLIASMYSGLLGQHLPGPNTVIMKFACDMLRPVMVGDSLEYNVAVSGVSEATGAVTMAVSATNQRGEIVNRGTAVCVFRHER